VKAIAAGLILMACSGMGFVLASSYTQRVYHLRELIRLMQVLESEIQFSRTTLPTFLAVQAPLFRGVVGRFLTALSQGLQAGTGESFAALWQQALGILADNGLPPDVLEDLHFCGAALGRSDAAEQSKQIQQLLIRLERALAAAEQERDQHVRLWQYLGVAAGLFLVLLLI